MDVFKAVVKKDGVLGLYHGVPSQLFRTVLATALLLTTKERIAASTARYIPLLAFMASNPTLVSSMLRARLQRRTM